MVGVEINHGVAVVCIDRPDRLNALDAAANERLVDVWTQLHADDSVRVCIVTGTGDRAFCAGSDLKAAAEGSVVLDPAPVGGLTKGQPFFKPVVAAVNGLAYGGGLELMLATDLRIAVPAATFALPEVRWGLIAGGGGLVRLPFNLPWAIASEMVLRGRVLTADEAWRFGLINAIVEADKLMATALDWAREIAELSPIACRTSKETMWRSRGMDPDAALLFEERMSYAVQMQPDAAEGLTAFAARRTEQRPPLDPLLHSS
jgi:enoyl-CoA hydratase/carnithine racemase